MNGAQGGETPPPPTLVDVRAWAAERLTDALRQRPDVTAALGGAVTCDQATVAFDALVQLGATQTAGTLRLAHHRRCGGLHDWRAPTGFPWDDELDAARTLAQVLTAPGVVGQVAQAWLSPAGEMRLVLAGLDAAAARAWQAACTAADAAWWAANGDQYAYDRRLDDQ